MTITSSPACLTSSDKSRPLACSVPVAEFAADRAARTLSSTFLMCLAQYDADFLLFAFQCMMLADSH